MPLKDFVNRNFMSNTIEKKLDTAIELTTALRKRIEELLDPPQPEFVSLKQACFILNRTNAIVNGYFKDYNVSPVRTLGKTKTYAYKDIERVARILGTTPRKLTA